jgi:hypothetical protein
LCNSLTFPQITGNYEKQKIESFQIEAVRFITKATKLSSIEKLYNGTLATRRKKLKLIRFDKMKNHITLTYLSNIITEQTQNRYQLRNFNNIPIVNSRTQHYQDSFLLSVIRDWNKLNQAQP